MSTLICIEPLSKHEIRKAVREVVVGDVRGGDDLPQLGDRHRLAWTLFSREGCGGDQRDR
jgi:hypothetical protein